MNILIKYGLLKLFIETSILPIPEICTNIYLKINLDDRFRYVTPVVKLILKFQDFIKFAAFYPNYRKTQNCVYTRTLLDLPLKGILLKYSKL